MLSQKQAVTSQVKCVWSDWPNTPLRSVDDDSIVDGEIVDGEPCDVPISNRHGLTKRGCQTKVV